MLEQYDQITAACEAIQERWSHQPKVGIILGSGLGNAAQGVLTVLKFHMRRSLILLDQSTWTRRATCMRFT